MSSSEEPPKTPSSSSNVKAFSTGKHAAANAAVAALPPPITLEDVIREQTQTRRLLTEHIQHAIEERKAAKARDEAIMSILKDVLARLP